MRCIRFGLIASAAVCMAHAASKPVADSTVVMEVSSGGVSLGSYQGGYLYARTLALKDSSMYRILTGASAGAINTLGGLYYSFHQPHRHWNPYKAWLKLDWKNLIRKEPKNGRLFDTDAIAAELDPILDSVLTPPDNPDSIPKAVWIGFATTRFLPRVLQSKALSSDKMDEKIVLGFQWLKQGHPGCADSSQGCWRAWTEVNPRLGPKKPQLFLDFGPSGTDMGLIRGHLKDLALASSAFPVAFERHPVRLELLESGVNADRYGLIGRVWEGQEHHPCRYTRDRNRMDAATLLLLPTGDKAYGKWKRTRYPTFSDGGLFENEPLNLAKRIHETLKTRYGDKGMKDVAALRFILPMHYDSMFMDTTVAQIRRSAATEWLMFTQVRQGAAAERMEVTRFLEDTDIHDSVFALSTTSLPLASEHFAHFSGFFAREFRDFDFTVGMHDAFEAFLPGSAESRRQNGLAMVAALDDTLHGQLEYLWGRIDTLYAAHRLGKTLYKDSTQVRLKALIQAVDKLKEDLVPLAPDSLKPFATVLNGSLSRLRGTLESINNSGDEGSSEQFDHFDDGYSKPSNLSNLRSVSRNFERLTLNRHMANEVYGGLRELLDDEEMGLESSFYYPLALYHSRAAMGAAMGATPSFHTPYIRIDGSRNGFRFLQGIPLGRYPFSVEVGEHLLPDVWFASRHNVFAHIEYSLCWWFMANIGFAWEGTFDFETKSTWPRADLVFVDALVIGLDFSGKNPETFEPLESMGIPKISLGSRIGFDLYKFMKGTINGVNSQRTVK